MNPDLRGEFETAFDREPPLKPPDVAVVAGRGALRRRRIAMGAVALGVSALAVGVVNLVDEPSPDPAPIERPEVETPGDLERRLTENALIDRSWRQDCGHTSQPDCDSYLADAAPIGMRADGGLVRISDRVIIVNLAVDPSPPSGGRRIEVEVRTPQSVHPGWWVLTRDADGRVTARFADGSLSTIAGDPSRAWLAWVRAINGDRELAGAPPLTLADLVIGE